MSATTNESECSDLDAPLGPTRIERARREDAHHRGSRRVSPPPRSLQWSRQGSPGAPVAGLPPWVSLRSWTDASPNA